VPCRKPTRAGLVGGQSVDFFGGTSEEFAEGTGEQKRRVVQHTVVSLPDLLDEESCLNCGAA